MTNDLTITEIGTINALGWTPPRNLTEKQWLAMAPAWGALHKGSKFGLGDWINHGEKKYGETYAQAEHLTGINPDLLMNYAYVSRSVPISLRNENLSWWHHKLVAPYTHQQIAKILDKADRGEWTSTKLSQFLKRWRRWVEGPPRLPKGRKIDQSASMVLPLFSAVRDDVIQHYPTASSNQASDFSRFVVDQLKTYSDNGQIEQPSSTNWKRLTRIALKARRGWKRIGMRLQEENAALKVENASQFQEIVELNQKLDALDDPVVKDDKDWRDKILEDY